mmetsp:Transcript_2523/g.3619  ORF Transcript_2523/g.3619 Transcript_2523/m.3619 type:complete len:94 (+) Transcript_2523:549-830(+)
MSRCALHPIIHQPTTSHARRNKRGNYPGDILANILQHITPLVHPALDQLLTHSTLSQPQVTTGCVNVKHRVSEAFSTELARFRTARANSSSNA